MKSAEYRQFLSIQPKIEKIFQKNIKIFLIYIYIIYMYNKI